VFHRPVRSTLPDERAQPRVRPRITAQPQFGKLEARGVPAILLGAAAIVLAAGAARAVLAGTPHLPDTIRELRGLLESNRSEPKRIGS